MHACDHVTWFQLAECINSEKSKDFVVTDTSRFHRLVANLPRPTEQQPSLIFLLGKRRGTKDAFLRYLFTHGQKSSQHRGIANLRVETSSLQSDYPLFYADSNVEPQVDPAVVPSPCHPTNNYTISWSCGSAQTAADILFTRVILPRCGVFIIFVDDFAASSDIHRLLSRWSSLSVSSGVLRDVKPRLMIVHTPSKHASETFELRFLAADESIRSLFSTITHVALEERTVSMRMKFLSEFTKKEAAAARQKHIGSYALFSAMHSEALCNASLAHVARNIAEPFDPLATARHFSLHDGSIVKHIFEFLNTGIKYAMINEDATQYIASALFMDAYPPGSHLFDPEVVFQRLYHASCSSAFRSFYGPTECAALQAKRTQTFFVKQFRTFKAWSAQNEDASSAKLHAEVSQNAGIMWPLHKSNLTCLYCLVRLPQRVLTCDHSICDTCLMIFGAGLPSEGYSFSLAKCVLCHNGSLEVNIKPPTCGSRIIGIDGGGTRGVVPLEFLSLLQSSIGSDCKITDFFDLAVGTSAGGLIVLALFMCQWDISKCCEVFEDFVKRYFGTNKKSTTRRMRRLLKGCVKDGIYPPMELEDDLQRNFGIGGMMDAPQGGVSGPKVAVIGSQNGISQVFSNYNAVNSGYGYERSTRAAIWEAARATSAAPVYFPPYESSVGRIRDGGLRHNCPVRIALCEQRCIWPSLERLDIFVSLGTGSTKVPFVPPPHDRSWLSNTISSFLSIPFITDMYKTFSSTMESDDIYHQTLDQRTRDEAKKSYRFNVQIGEAMEIDDTTRLEELKHKVHTQPFGQFQRDVALSVLLVASFYFELDQLPIYEEGRYRCRGTIKCRNTSFAVIRNLKKLHPSFPMTFVFSTAQLARLNATIATLSEDDICSWCHRYSKQVVFYVAHIAEEVTLSLRTDELDHRQLSNFPTSMENLIQQQNLTAVFGTANHSIPAKFRCHKCEEDGNLSKRPLLCPLEPVGKRVRFN